MHDAGKVTVCTLTNTASAGAMPAERLVPFLWDYFEERTVGYGRYYTARGVNEFVDMLIRTWRHADVRIGMYAVLSDSENNGQYRITNVQQLLDDDGLKVTDMTLERLDELYALDNYDPVGNQNGTGQGNG